MGAHDVTHYISGYENDLKGAYRQLVDNALHDHGYDGYNGTISTTSGVHQVFPTAARIAVSRKEAENFAEARFDHIEKRGHCEAILVREEKPEVSKQLLWNYCAELTVDSSVMEMSYEERHDLLSKKMTAHVRSQLKKGETLVAQRGQRLSAPAEEVKNIKAQGIYGHTFLPQSVTETVVEKSERVTKYFIVTTDNKWMPEWKDGFETQAQARAALPKSLKRGSLEDEYEIISMTRRQSGAGLVSHKVTTKKSKTVKVKVEATIVKVIEPAKETGGTGWYIYGMAAS